MAARARKKTDPKSDEDVQTRPQTGRKRAPAPRKAEAPRSSEPAAKKTPPKRATTKASRAGKKAKSQSARGSARADDQIAMLIEQNEALGAELKEAHARIARLEELNKQVLDRIDWVIDSLQSVLE